MRRYLADAFMTIAFTIAYALVVIVCYFKSDEWARRNFGEDL